MQPSRCYAQEAEAAAEATFEQKSLETLGATLVAYCLNAHVNATLVADSYAEEIMESEQAIS